MAIVPQRRISKTRKRQRRSHFKLDNPSMMICPNCGEVKLAHIVCNQCGYYNGKLVKEIKVKKEEDEEIVEEKETKKTKKAKKTEKVESSEKEVKSPKEPKEPKEPKKRTTKKTEDKE